MEAAIVTRIMVEEVFARFGIPDQNHSDHAHQFESRLLAEMCELLENDKMLPMAYHPKSDGIEEWFYLLLEVISISVVCQYISARSVHSSAGRHLATHRFLEAPMIMGLRYKVENKVVTMPLHIRRAVN